MKNCSAFFSSLRAKLKLNYCHKHIGSEALGEKRARLDLCKLNWLWKTKSFGWDSRYSVLTHLYKRCLLFNLTKISIIWVILGSFIFYSQCYFIFFRHKTQMGKIHTTSSKLTDKRRREERQPRMMFQRQICVGEWSKSHWVAAVSAKMLKDIPMATEIIKILSDLSWS